MMVGTDLIQIHMFHLLLTQVGTEAEHAVLLANYLTGLGRTTYLVLGRGVPEGKTAYCLTIEVGCQQ